MNDNLPPLPPCAPEFKPRWPNDPGGYNEEQMQAYARAAIERQSVPVDFETTVREYIDEYEMLGETEDGRDGCYTPNENDKALLFDAFMGFDFSPWRAAAPQPQPVQEPVLKVYKGDICYKSKADDQSYGMWCQVSYEYQHGLPDGTVFYTSPQAQPAQPLSDERLCEAMRKAAEELLDHIYEFSTISEGVNPRLLAVGRSIEHAHGITKGTT